MALVLVLPLRHARFKQAGTRLHGELPRYDIRLNYNQTSRQEFKNLRKSNRHYFACKNAVNIFVCAWLNNFETTLGMVVQ